jgi:Mor family transcriptional regulator
MTEDRRQKAERELPEVYQEIEALLDRQSAKVLAEHFGGQQVYFPYWDSGHKERDEAIVQDRGRGFSLAELSRKYGLTERRIRDILESKRVKQRQMTLI